MFALFSTIVTTTNCLFVTVPPWAPTNAPAEWVAYGNWRDGERAGSECVRLAETNAAAVFSCVDGYYERAEVARIPFGSSVVDEFPSQHHWRTNAVKFAENVRAEWTEPPRAITNSVRLLSWSDPVAVASKLVGAAVEARPKDTSYATVGLYHTGLMRSFGSPWLDATIQCPSFLTNGQWAIVMPHTLGGVYPPSFGSADAFETAMEWRDAWPTWGRCAYGDAIFPDVTNGLSGVWRFYDCDQTPGSGAAVAGEAPWVTLFRLPDEWRVLETFAAERQGWTFARAASSMLPLGGYPTDRRMFEMEPLHPHESTNGISATDAMMVYCNLATNIMPHVTNRTFRLDRERQGAINVCEAACRYTYSVADASGCWLGQSRLCRSQTHYKPVGTATFHVEIDEFTGEIVAHVVPDVSWLYFVPETITNDFVASPAFHTHGPLASVVMNGDFSFSGADGFSQFGTVSLFDTDETGWRGFSDALRTYLEIAGVAFSDGDEVEAEIWNVRIGPGGKSLLSSIVAVRVNGGVWVSDFAAEDAARRTIRANFSGDYVYDFHDIDNFEATSLLEANDSWSTNLVISSLPQGVAPTDALWNGGFVRGVRTYALQCVTGGMTNRDVTVSEGARTFATGVFVDNEMRVLSFDGFSAQNVLNNRREIAIALNAAVLTNFNARVGAITGMREKDECGGMALLSYYQNAPAERIQTEDFTDRISLACEIDERHPHIIWRGAYHGEFGTFDNLDGWDLTRNAPYATNGICTVVGYSEVATLTAHVLVQECDFTLPMSNLTDRSVFVHGRQGECHRTDWSWKNLSEPKEE